MRFQACILLFLGSGVYACSSSSSTTGSATTGNDGGSTGVSGVCTASISGAANANNEQTNLAFDTTSGQWNALANAPGGGAANMTVTQTSGPGTPMVAKILIALQGKPQAGRQYTFVRHGQEGAKADTALLLYSEANRFTDWTSAGGGTLTIDEAAGTTVKFSFSNAPMVPEPTLMPNPPKPNPAGTFNMSGQCTITNFKNL